MAIINFISTIWSENLMKQLDQKYVGVMNCSREFEGDIKNQGSVVKICGVGDVTVSDYTKNSDMSAPETLSDYARTLQIDQAKYFNFQIDDVDRAQSNPKLMDEAMRVAAAALAKEADSYVYSLYENSDNEISVNGAYGEDILNKIIEIRTSMAHAGVTDVNDIVFEVSPEIAALILRAKMDFCNDNVDVFESGLIGKFVGCKVYVSNNIVLDEDGFHKCIVRTKRAVAFAEQISEVEAYRPEKRFADAVKGLHLYGAKIVYPEEFYVLSLKPAA